MIFTVLLLIQKNSLGISEDVVQILNLNSTLITWNIYNRWNWECGIVFQFSVYIISINMGNILGFFGSKMKMDGKLYRNGTTALGYKMSYPCPLYWKDVQNGVVRTIFKHAICNCMSLIQILHFCFSLVP